MESDIGRFMFDIYQCYVCTKTAYIWVSELCLGLFGWRLSVSEDVLIPNLLEKIYRSWQLIYGLVFQCPPIPENAYGRGCLDGVCGCQTVSGSYLGVSGRCLGEYRCHKNLKQLNNSYDIKLMHFLPVTKWWQNGHFTLLKGSGGKFWDRMLIFSPNALYTITTKPCEVTHLNSNMTYYRHGLHSQTYMAI